MIETLKFRIGKYLIPVEACRSHGRIFFKFSFNRSIMDEIRSMEGPQWHCYDGAPHRALVKTIYKTDKIWSVLDCPRNNFQLEYLQMGNPYQVWDDYLKNGTRTLEYKRPLREHQKEMTEHILSVHYGIWAAEMGTGKTLSSIEAMERSGVKEFWYVGPKSALRAVDQEMSKWGSKIQPVFMSYNKLVKEMREWEDGRKAPQFLVLDESQKVKTPKAQRTQAALALANGIRADHGFEGYVLLMSGSPAPKAPIDWWAQAEIAYPGFLKEGNINKFKFRLGLFEETESFAGGMFHKRLTWLDDETKCAICGEEEDHMVHDFEIADPNNPRHEFKSSVNEVAKLYKRMAGLVIVKFKKDCMDLPDKQYRIVNCEVLPSTIRAAKVIAANTPKAAQALIKLRELSDGFQYKQVVTGEKDCPLCAGSGEMDDFTIKPEYAEHYEETGEPEEDWDDDFAEENSDELYHTKYFDAIKTTCATCGGHRKVPEYSRDVDSIPCPKDEAFRDILEEHEDVGRLVVYAGFEGSINRCVKTAISQKWAVIKWDGKGVKVWDAEGNALATTSKQDEHGIDSKIEPLTMFQVDKDTFPRVVFIGNPGAAGTGLTLTASPSILYYSNTFNAEERIQSEDRIHRLGMDENRGATIIDLIHLPTDSYILNNLKEKRKLQDVSMGALVNALDASNPVLIET